MSQKQKRDIKTAQEKVRAELRNQIDAVKNEMARAKAEWERERKKLILEHDSALANLKNELEDQGLDELRDVKDKAEKASRKRLADKDAHWQQKIDELV